MQNLKGLLVKTPTTNAELNAVRELLWQYVEWRGFDAALAKIEAEM